jgi:hypothetical protein
MSLGKVLLSHSVLPTPRGPKRKKLLLLRQVRERGYTGSFYYIKKVFASLNLQLAKNTRV